MVSNTPTTLSPEEAVSRITALMNEALNRPTSAPYRAEIIEATATAFEKRASQLRHEAFSSEATKAPIASIEKNAKALRRAARTFRLITESEGEREWGRCRRATPLLQRLRIPRAMPTQFLDDWIIEQRERARNDIAASLTI